MGNQAILISTPDGNWEMLYINGKSVYSDDNLYAGTLLRMLKDHLPISNIEVKELSWECCNGLDWEFPNDFSEYSESDFN